MSDTASALLSASTRMLEDLAAGHRPLSTVSSTLADLAAALGVRKVVVAIDDAECGRQVFTSGRAPLGDATELLFGPPRACTEPSRPLDDALSRLIIASVAAAFERARSAPTPVTRPDDLTTVLAAATDRAERYGWQFTLVVLRLERADGDATRAIRSRLRAGDTLIELGPRAYAIIVAGSSGDDVPHLLGRVGRGGAFSSICYGLAACPAEASDPDALLALADSRLRDAERLRVES